MARPPLFSLCSLLMASLFAVSASFQFNDSDWYFWVTLYTTACIVNMVNGIPTQKIDPRIAKFALWLGIFLFIKLVLEDGFWSLDLRDRVVREKVGTWKWSLVISSMFLQLQGQQNAKIANYGMAALVGISYGLSIVFFKYQKIEMKY